MGFLLRLRQQADPRPAEPVQPLALTALDRRRAGLLAFHAQLLAMVPEQLPWPLNNKFSRKTAMDTATQLLSGLATSASEEQLDQAAAFVEGLAADPTPLLNIARLLREGVPDATAE